MREQFRGQDGVKPADMIRPERAVTKLNVCFPGEDGARESEMRANYVPLESAYNKEDAQRIKAFLTKPTDPNSTKGSADHDYTSTNMADYGHMHDKQPDDSVTRNKEKHTRTNQAMAYENAKPEYVSQTRASLEEAATK